MNVWLNFGDVADDVVRLLLVLVYVILHFPFFIRFHQWVGPITEGISFLLYFLFRQALDIEAVILRFRNGALVHHWFRQILRWSAGMYITIRTRVLINVRFIELRLFYFPLAAIFMNKLLWVSFQHPFDRELRNFLLNFEFFPIRTDMEQALRKTIRLTE